MKSLEQIKQEIMDRAAKDIEKAEKEIAIRESLPVQPKFVHVYPLYKSIGSAAYEVNTKAEALEIFEKFAVSPSFICRDSSTSIKCFDDETAKTVEEILACVEIDKFGAKLKFFTEIPAGMLQIEIRLPVHLFGRYYRDDPRAKINYRLQFDPLPKTREMFQAIQYASAERRGEGSAKTIVYALYERDEVINQLGE